MSIKTVFAGIGIVLLVGVGVTTCNVIGFGVNTATKVVTKTLDADNIIYNYEWFKRQFNDIEAFSQQLTFAKDAVENFKKDSGPREKWTFEDKQEYARLNSIVLGLQNTRQAMIADYNAKSSMVNRSIFKTGDLPNFIDTNSF